MTACSPWRTAKTVVARSIRAFTRVYQVHPDGLHAPQPSHVNSWRGGHACEPYEWFVFLILVVMLASPMTGLAQAPQRFPLWDSGAPGALGQADSDTPALTVYRATHHTVETGIIVAPGGGYRSLSMNMEGREVAALFNAIGVAAFVLDTGSVPATTIRRNSETHSARFESSARAPPSSGLLRTESG